MEALCAKLVKLIVSEIRHKKPKEHYKVLINNNPQLKGMTHQRKAKILQRINNFRRKFIDPKRSNVVRSKFDLIAFNDENSLEEVSKDPDKDFFVADKALCCGDSNNPLFLSFAGRTCISYLMQQKKLNDSIGIMVIDATYKIIKLKYSVITV